MKVRYLLILLCLLAVGCSESDAGLMMMSGGTPAAAPPAECTGLLICQNFEGTGYDNSETWTEAGTVTEDYTTTILRGTQSCLVHRGPPDASLDSPAFAASGTVHMMLRFQVSNVDNAWDMIKIRNAANADICIAELYTNVFHLHHGTATANGTFTVSVNTLYYVWIDYVKGTGANGTAAIYVSSTGTKPAADASLTTGSSSTDATHIRFEEYNDKNLVVDQIYVDDAVLGDAPA